MKYDTYFRDFWNALELKKSYLGCTYLSHALQLILENDSYLTNTSKALYVDVANHCHTSVSCVERDIRTVIKVIWKRGNQEFLKELGMDLSKDCPSNQEFLYYALRYISKRIHQ